MNWYHVREYAALWTLLDEMNAELDMQQSEPSYPGIIADGRCARCSSFHADLVSQETQHLADEAGWLEVVREKDRLLGVAHDRIAELEQQVSELVQQRKCNADYLRFEDVRAGGRE